LHRRQQQSDQDPNDRDDDQKLDQRKTAAAHRTQRPIAWLLPSTEPGDTPDRRPSPLVADGHKIMMSHMSVPFIINPSS
jgi:hypothetical protein